MPTLKSVQAEKKCPSCGCSYSDIAHDGRVGCADCYATFENELARTIQSVHGTTTHMGAVPSRHRAKQARAEELKRLKKAMQDAIAKEDFERAATLRDDIRKLEADGNGKDGE